MAQPAPANRSRMTQRRGKLRLPNFPRGIMEAPQPTAAPQGQVALIGECGIWRLASAFGCRTLTNYPYETRLGASLSIFNALPE